MVNNALFSAFEGKRVLITGDTGFKGSWLALWLKELGADVVGLALPPVNENDHYNLIGLKKLIHHVDCDIRDIIPLNDVFAKFEPEILFHLAAQPLVRYSYEQPKVTFDTNIAGSVNILEMVRLSASLRSAIFVTSDKCYRNKEWIWGYRENDELGGKDPYSASKAAAEIVFASYADAFFYKLDGLGVASVRAGNVIGGGDWAMDRIVPDSIRALEKGKNIVLRNPQATRPWQHVLEPLVGYLTLAAGLYDNPKQYSGSWNFGPRADSVRNVQQLTEKIIEYWGSGEIDVRRDQNQYPEANLLQLNCDKAFQVLRWKPQWGFDRTVEETVLWYKKICAGEDALPVSKDQIKRYMEDMRNDQWG